MPVKFRTVTPFLACPDVGKAMRFYIDKLGFREDWTWGDPVTDGGVCRDDMSLYFFLNAELAARVSGSELMLDVSPIEEVYAEHQSCGAPITSPLEDKPWHVREYTVTDPSGYKLRFCESLADIKERGGSAA